MGKHIRNLILNLFFNAQSAVCAVLCGCWQIKSKQNLFGRERLWENVAPVRVARMEKYLPVTSLNRASTTLVSLMGVAKAVFPGLSTS